MGSCEKTCPLQQKYSVCRWRHEEHLWKCDPQFLMIFMFSLGQELHPPPRLEKTTTTFGLMKPFEIPLDKLKNMLGGHAENKAALLCSWNVWTLEFLLNSGVVRYSKLFEIRWTHMWSKRVICLMVTVKIYLEADVTHTEKSDRTLICLICKV